MTTVAVWHATTADVFGEEARRRRARGWLSPADHARHERYRFQADQDMFLLGRVMARALVGQALGVGPNGWEWREGPRGRPEVADAGAADRVSFNIAHSAGLVVCAISSDGTVGVDVEHRLRSPVDARMIRRYCAPCGGRGHRAAWTNGLARPVPQVLDAERGLPESARPWHCSAPLRSQLHAGRRCDSAGTAQYLVGRRRGEWAFTLDAFGASHFVAAAVTARPDPRPTFSIAQLPHDLLP